MKLYTPNQANNHNGSGSMVDGMISQIEMLLDDGRVLEKEIMKAQLK